MSRVKELFGVEVEEKFDIDSNGGGTIKNCFFDRTGALVVPDFDYLDVDTLILLTALISGEAKIEKAKKPVLDDVEKKFIGNIIRPFDVKDITKVKCTYQDKLFIIIRLTNSEEILLPFFSSTSGMYKGMELNKSYSPEELGL